MKQSLSKSVGALFATLVGACTGVAVRAQVPPEPLGTLLFSPQERAQIALERSPGAGSAQTAPASVLRYHGVVRRSDGKSTVWVNDKAQVEGDVAAPRLRGLDAVLAGHPLRVGESIQTTTGQRQDVTAPGALTVRRAP